MDLNNRGVKVVFNTLSGKIIGRKEHVDLGVDFIQNGSSGVSSGFIDNRD